MLEDIFIVFGLFVVPFLPILFLGTALMVLLLSFAGGAAFDTTRETRNTRILRAACLVMAAVCALILGISWG